MTTRSRRSKYALSGATVALLLGTWSTSALASSGFKTHCSEVTHELPAPEIPAPSLNIKLADHGLIDATADMNAPASEPGNETLPSPALADIKNKSAPETANDDNLVEDAKAVPVSKPSETALTLPGVPEEDQPRFRRQMYRTDI